jgi:hypothetical protein
VIEREREQLPRPWSTRQLEELARLSRPLRRRLAPSRFKETYVNRALARYERPTAYVEIGVREGESFRIAQADSKIGIDPERTQALATLLPGEQFFELTSDEFFEGQASDVLAPASVHVALVDGLHEFRQVLTDVLNLGPYMRPDGVVIVDDCNPRTAERAAEIPIGGAWNGDVWKLPAYLLEARRDLRVATVDADEGVGVICGFGSPHAPPDPAEVERFKSLPYEHLARDRKATLNLVAPSAFDALLPQILRESHSSSGRTTPRH